MHGHRKAYLFIFSLSTEVLLSTLISRFTFSATKDEIVWNLSQIISPSVKAVDANGVVEERKGLPLIVREVKLGYE